MMEASYEAEKDWKMDPSGYFIIKVFYSEQKLGVRHYPPDQLGRNAKHDAELFGNDSYALLQSIVKRGLVTTMQHAAYLGHELQKAEIAMRQELEYIQDAPLDFSKKNTKDPSENIKRK